MVKPYRGQNYTALKKDALKSGQLFRDPHFPPTDRSLFYVEGRVSGIEWKRPKDICSDPHLFVDGVSSQDLVQGDLGNCWFVAACAALASNRGNWTQVIPDHKEQEFSAQHVGIFHFRFWQYGEWIDVVIDDFLPTRNGKLIYVHSKSRNEFWSALLEKAYAKLYGCYEALDGGELAEALEDFTGGVSESYDMEESKYYESEQKMEEFFDSMKKSVDNYSLLCAAIPAKKEEEMEQPTEVGLIKGHAYSVTAVKKVPLAGTGIFHIFNREKLPMIRLRNPWGGKEWTGAFSDGSPEWAKIAKGDRDKIGLTFEDDGEFWMTLADFCRYFLNLAVCHTVNTSFFSLSKRWHESLMHSEWIAPGRGGGCINNKATFLNNPQFLFDITDDNSEALIQVVQKSTRRQGEERMTIGVTLLKVEVNRMYRVHTMPTVMGSSVFRNSRSMLLRKVLPIGRYIAVPCTFEPGLSGEFLIRLYTSASSSAKELTLDAPKPSTCCSCLPACRDPVCVTQIKIVKAVGLERKNKSTNIDAYCVITCEGQKVRTPIVKGTAAPEWNCSAIFYRKRPVQKTITVDIYSSSVGFDEFLGRQVYIAAQDCRDQPVDLPLKTKDMNNVTPGRILVTVSTEHNLAGL